MNSFIITSDGISLVLNGKPYSANKTHLNYTIIIDAVRSQNFAVVPNLINVAPVVHSWVNKVVGNNVVVDVVAGSIYYKGTELHNTMVDRILIMMREGFSVTPMINLLNNLYENPSNKAVEELYTFLEYGKMPITEDGCFLAYKRVNTDYTSCYDSKTSNKIGEVVSMPRYLVDDRSEQTCSHGLHICSFEYLASYSGARVIVVKVNPADVVSIPTDYNNTKARVCQYEVISELTFEEAGLGSHSFGASVYTTPGTEHKNWESIEDDDDFWNEDGSEEDILNDWFFNESNEDEDGERVDDAGIYVGPTPDTTEVEKQKQEIADTVHKILVDRANIAEEIRQSTSTYFKIGYHNGYYCGKLKLPIDPDVKHISEDPSVAGTDSDTTGMSHQDVKDVNDGYNLGYADGRGHKTRRFKKVN
jgi:hypothetical protein